ncbi:DciA family protein [Corynebacterium bovis]
MTHDSDDAVHPADHGNDAEGGTGDRVNSGNPADHGDPRNSGDAAIPRGDAARPTPPATGGAPGDVPAAESDPIAQAMAQIRRLRAREAGARGADGNGGPGGVPGMTGGAAGASDRDGFTWNTGGPTGGARRRGRRPARMKTRFDGRLDRSYRDPGSFSDLVQREIRRRGWGKRVAAGTLQNHWEEIVGPTIASHTTIVMYKEKEKQLHIECDSTAWATNLRYMQRTVLQTIAQRIGPDIVAQLKIYGPRPPSWRHGKFHVSGRGPRDTYG